MFTRDEALRLVEGANSSTGLFGDFSPDRAQAAHRLWRDLLVALHPDRTGPDDHRAHAAAAEVTRLHDRWAGSGSASVELRTARRAYRTGALHRVGSVANVHLTDGPEVVKVVRKPALSPLLLAERDALTALARLTDEHRWLAPYFPRLVDASGEAGRGERAFTVLAPLTDGFHTLAEVKRAYPGGLDGRDWAWMHRRLLRAVAGAHLAGLVHGAITADNVLVHPERHGVVLAGWSFAVELGQRPLAKDRTTAYPPEVAAGQALTGATDVWMAHALMLDLLAPGERRQRLFAEGCTQDSPSARPEAADLLDEYDDLLDDLYGPRVFRPFSMTDEGA